MVIESDEDAYEYQYLQQQQQQQQQHHQQQQQNYTMTQHNGYQKQQQSYTRAQLQNGYDDNSYYYTQDISLPPPPPPPPNRYNYGYNPRYSYQTNNYHVMQQTAQQPPGQYYNSMQDMSPYDHNRTSKFSTEMTVGATRGGGYNGYQQKGQWMYD